MMADAEKRQEEMREKASKIGAALVEAIRSLGRKAELFDRREQITTSLPTYGVYVGVDDKRQFVTIASDQSSYGWRFEPTGKMRVKFKGRERGRYGYFKTVQRPEPAKGFDYPVIAKQIVEAYDFHEQCRESKKAHEDLRSRKLKTADSLAKEFNLPRWMIAGADIQVADHGGFVLRLNVKHEESLRAILTALTPLAMKQEGGEQ